MCFPDAVQSLCVCRGTCSYLSCLSFFLRWGSLIGCDKEGRGKDRNCAAAAAAAVVMNQFCSMVSSNLFRGEGEEEEEEEKEEEEEEVAARAWLD